MPESGMPEPAPESRGDARDRLGFGNNMSRHFACTGNRGRVSVRVMTRVLMAALVATLFAAEAPAPLTAQGAGHSLSFRSTVSLVALNVTVQDLKSQYVTGLRPEDFLVLEDGVRQDVRFFEADSLPVDLIVLLDTSRSMDDKLAIAQTAARGLLDTLRDGDRGAVIAFSDSVRVLQPLTSNRTALANAAGAAVAGGNTVLRTALYVALRQFGMRIRSNDAVRRQAIAVLSDGEDTASLVSFDDVLALARQTGVNIYTVRLPSSVLAWDDEPQIRRLVSEADYEMKTLARETGALSFFPQPEQLPAVYGAIASEVANQYSIGYEATREHDDGRFRRVQVQIVSRPELRARTRAGYIAGGVRSGSH